MLPKPVTVLNDRRGRHAPVFSLRRSSLLARSRATNLAVLGLASFAFFSFLLNLQFYYFSSHEQPLSSPLGVLASLPELQHHLNHLIIVPGHAIWQGTDPDLRMKAEEWAFQSYQTNQDTSRLEVFFQHISSAAQLANEDKHSLVVFSGGQTQRASTTTEGESYHRLALKAGLFHTDAFTRATSENYALDSFQNLLFSIARFYEFTGHYPERITVVGYEMKRARFMELHRAAIRWPEASFKYIGIDISGQDNSLAWEGERQNGYQPYASDLYGCHTFLSQKRRQRNYAARYPPYYLSNPELMSILSWCPQDYTELFSGALSWSADEFIRRQE